MPLRTKTLLIIISTYACLVLSVYVLFWVLLIAGFSKIEQIGVELELKQFNKLIQNISGSLVNTANDWSKWDETYFFVNDKNQSYIDGNLNKNSFNNLEIHVMSFINIKGEIVYTKIQDENLNSSPELTQQFNKTITNLPFLQKFENKTSNHTGFILINNKPMLITSAAIYDSNTEGECRGTYIIGKFLNLEQIQKSYEYPLHFYQYNNNSEDPDIKEVLTFLNKDNTSHFSKTNNKKIDAYSLINNIKNKPLLIAKIEIPRSIYGQSKETLYYTMIILCILTILFAFITHLLLDRFVIKRLKKLSTAVNEINKAKDPSIRLHIRGDDELSMLVRSINQMLTEIENANISLELKRKNLELLRVQLLEANIHRNRFLSSVSHELRTPLNAILGFSEVLNQKIFGPLNPKQDEYLNLIHSSGKHLLELINDLLDITKIDSGSIELVKEEFSHDIFIKEVINMVSPQASEKNITLQLKLDVDCIICADLRRSKQILLNLLTNAIKFSSKDSCVEIKSEIKSNHIKIYVTDTGIGIPEADHRNIFTEFFQAKNAKDGLYGGTGIGLALSQRLVKLQGGEIGFKSKLKEGSIFWFTLPIKALNKKNYFDHLEKGTEINLVNNSG